MSFFRFTAGWSDQPVRPALLFCVPEIVRDRIRILWEDTPGPPTTSYPGVAQLVVRLLWEQDGAGSVARTTFSAFFVLSLQFA